MIDKSSGDTALISTLAYLTGYIPFIPVFVSKECVCTKDLSFVHTHSFDSLNEMKYDPEIYFPRYLCEY